MNSSVQWFCARMRVVGRLIARFYGTPYSWTITLFFVWQAFFLCVFEGENERAFTASLMISVHVIVVCNTVAFLHRLLPKIAPDARPKGLSKKEMRTADGSYRACMWGLVAGTCLAGGLAVSIAFGLAGIADESYWPRIMQWNEAGSLIVFAWFCFADYSGYVALRTPLRNGRGAKKHRQEAEDIMLLICAVDVPGLLGIAFIMVCSHILYPQVLPFFYWHGFTAGAIGLHIVFSQVALSLIAARERPLKKAS